MLMRPPRIWLLPTVLALALVPFGCAPQRATVAASPAPAVSAASTVTADAVVPAGGLVAIASDVAQSALPANQRAAFRRFAATNVDRPEAYVGKTVQQIVDFEIAHENGLASIVNYDRKIAANAKQLGVLVDARVVSGRDGDRIITFDVILHNKTGKAFKHVDLGMVATDVLARAQVGAIELNIDQVVPPHATVQFSFPVRYANFGSATGTMIAAAHRAKTYTVRPDHIVYADGREIGIDDD
jgi:hypothetical protein